MNYPYSCLLTPNGPEKSNSAVSCMTVTVLLLLHTAPLHKDRLPTAASLACSTTQSPLSADRRATATVLLGKAACVHVVTSAGHVSWRPDIIGSVHPAGLLILRCAPSRSGLPDGNSFSGNTETNLLLDTVDQIQIRDEMFNLGKRKGGG